MKGPELKSMTKFFFYQRRVNNIYTNSFIVLQIDRIFWIKNYNVLVTHKTKNSQRNIPGQEAETDLTITICGIGILFTLLIKMNFHCIEDWYIGTSKNYISSQNKFARHEQNISGSMYGTTIMNLSISITSMRFTLWH